MSVPEYLLQRVQAASKLLPKEDRAAFVKSIENKVGCDDPPLVELEHAIDFVLSARGIIRGPR